MRLGAPASSPAGTQASSPAPRRRRAAAWPAAVTAAFLLFPQIVQACPVCFGDPNAAMTKGTNNGIFFLLGIIGFVQLGFVTMFWSFWRRARALRARRDAMRIIDGGQFR